MRSIFRFLVFVLIVALAVATLYFWRIAARPASPSVELAKPGAPMLLALDGELTTLVSSVVPSVVSITAIPPDAINPRAVLLKKFLGIQPVTSPELGSGVIVSPEGHIVTNLHVISHAAAVQVNLSDGRTCPAKFVGADQLSDIAILKIDAKGLKPLEFGNSDQARVGQMVFAVGNPLGLQETVTQGIISAKGRRTSEAANEFLQTDAAINPGNSGGPLIDTSGRVIGINNAILPQVSGSGYVSGIGFAIPSNTVKKVFESIRDFGHFVRPWFGVTTGPNITPELQAQLGLEETRGAFVEATTENSPAERAGLQPGDVIVDFDGRAIVDSLDLRNRVAETNPGQPVTLTVWRDGRNLSLKAVIEPQPGT